MPSDITYEITDEKNLIPSQKQILPIPYINIDKNGKINILNTYTGYSDIITVRYKLNEEPTDQDGELMDDMSLSDIGKYYFRAFSSNSLYEPSPSFIVKNEFVDLNLSSWNFVKRDYIPSMFAHYATAVDFLQYLDKINLFLRSSQDYGLQYSSDGINWTYCYITGNTHENNRIRVTGKSVAFDGNKYVAVSNYESNSTGPDGYNCSLISTDGINWTSYSQTDSDWGGDIFECIYANNHFYTLIQSNGNVFVFYSEDGISWNKVLIEENGSGRYLLYGNNKFLIQTNKQRVVEVGNQKFYESFDGIQWEEITNKITNISNVPVFNPSSSYMYKAKFLNDSFIVTSYSSTNNLYYTKDGYNWSTVELSNISENSFFVDVIYLKGKYYIGAGDHLMGESTDLLNWVYKGNETFPIHACHDLCYGKNMLLAYEYVGISNQENYIYTAEI